MNTDRPLLIVISSNRNYGWIVPVFLAANSHWADYIVITDQMSTDGSRDMYAQYDNVTVVDDKDMAFKENTRARMAFEKGRELAAGRDAIYFALDIDEMMPANWMETQDGKKILASKKGDMFDMKWADVQPDNKSYIEEPTYQYKIFHDNGMAWQFCEDELHAPHLPYSTYKVDPIHITNFPNVHFGHYNKKWRRFNSKFYRLLDVHQGRSKSVISVCRSLYPDPIFTKEPLQKLHKEWFYSDVNVFDLIDLDVQPQGVKLIKELIDQDGIDKFQCVDVWDEDLCKVN
jgi:hypothetical protein